ncbi:MAG: 23S rRNA (adenine(2503)-C(2))-methyltransferase RlmN [Clostridia bacterium]|nr:23S rRNA (adenine(2503)-C(2))-methyltransferase RlmN [Deltaproteobacteria bacterium]
MSAHAELVLRNALESLDALSAPPPDGRPNLLGVPLEELERFVTTANEPKYRAKQIFTGLFQRRVNAFADMTDISKSLRTAFESTFAIGRPRIDNVQASDDGTRKYKLVTDDGSIFEAVYIPEVAKGSTTNTLCVSSQTGCAVGCKFCFTASLRRNRNLSAAEIVGQVLAVRDDVAPLGGNVTNIVFMGMGEPLLNYAHVTRAIRILLDPIGAAFPSKRITVSTSGIIPRIYDLGRDLPTQLAISLNASTNAIRQQVMPITKKFPLEDLMTALRAYPLGPRRRITIEYVLLAGVNDSIEDARRLPHLLRDIPCKVNLLPLNEHDRTELKRPEWSTVLAFEAELKRHKMNAILRRPRGRDISAACGQLGESSPAQVTNRDATAALLTNS